MKLSLSVYQFISLSVYQFISLSVYQFISRLASCLGHKSNFVKQSQNFLVVALLFILASCEQVANFKTPSDIFSSPSLTANVFPNQILDGQQTVLTVKLPSVAGASGDTLRYEVVDGDGNLASDFFVSPQGFLTIAQGVDTATFHLTSIPSSIATGSETFKIRVSSNSISFHEGAAIKVSSSSESSNTVHTVSIVSLENNAFVNSSNQSSYDVGGVCSYVGGNIQVSVGAVSQNATCSITNEWSLSLNLSSVTEGNLQLKAVHSGNSIAGEAIRQIVKDVTVPTIVIASPAVNSFVGASNQNGFSLSGTCSDNSSLVTTSVTSSGGGSVSQSVPCNTLAWNIVQNVSSLVDGTLTATVNHVDLAGNSSSVQRTFIKNTIAPIVAITAPTISSVANALNYTTQTVSGTCNKEGADITLTGDVSGTLTTTCSGGAFTLSNITIIGADGFRSMMATLTDAYGNIAYSTAVMMKNTELPSATLSGRPGAVSNQEVLNITVGGSLVDKYQYKLGDSSLDCTAAAGYSAVRSISTPITNSLGADGSYKVCVVAISIYGNIQPLTSATSYEWVKNTVAPSMAISSPVANSYVNYNNVSGFVVSGTCGINGTNNVKIQGNLTTTYTNCTDGEWSRSLDFSSAGEGPVFILASQEDPDTGNVGQASRLFIKSTVLPSIAITAPAVNAYINKANRASFTVSGTCDTYSATPNIVVTGGSSPVSVACSGTTWTANIAFADESNGTPTVTATITDVAGNEKESSRVFTLDTVNPTVAFTSPSANSYINLANQASFTVSGSCSDAGTNRIVIKESSTTLATVNCGVGAPNWTANLNLSSLSQAGKTLTVTHTDAAGNSTDSTLALIKDTVAPTAGWSSPLAGVCLSTGTAGNFSIAGTCTSGDGVVNITSVSPSISTTATCNGSGEFTQSLNIDTTGLNHLDAFSIQVSQSDTAGNSTVSARSFSYIDSSIGVTFGGWDDVYAVGKKTYKDNMHSAEAGKVKIKWKEFPASNACIPDKVVVYRSASPDAITNGFAVSGEIPTTTKNFEDTTLVEADFGKAWYYGLKAIVAGIEIPVSTPSAVKEIRVIAPPQNMALVHRWIANQEVCGLIGRTSDANNNYRCPYSGQGKVTVGGNDFHDLQWDMLVDRNELGCNVTANCGASGSEKSCVATNFLSISNPSSVGVEAPIGAVYYNNTEADSPGRCWYKHGAANTNWTAVNSLTSTTIGSAVHVSKLIEATTNVSHNPPLVFVGSNQAHRACGQQEVTLSQVTSYADNTPNTFPATKRLPRQKEFRAAASWSLETPYFSGYTSIHDWINYLERGDARTGDSRVGKCNSNLNRTAAGLDQVSRGFTSDYEIHSLAFETGSKIATFDCQSRYGIQDLVGNVWEWGSDELDCPKVAGVIQGDKCVGRTSLKDTDNSDMLGFKFDGLQGPGDRRYASIAGFTIDAWIFDSAARNETQYFNAVLGLPLIADDGGGSVSISAFSTAGHLHGDYINLSPSSGNESRGLLLGGHWGNVTSAGRWAANLSNLPTNTYYYIGARCVLPVK